MNQLEIEKIISERNEWLAKQSIQDWNDEDTKHVVNAVLTSERQKVKDVVNALKMLVGLKDYKDNLGKDDTYERQQPIAWENAKKAIANYNESLK